MNLNRTRVARPASPLWNLTKTYLHMLYFWPVFYGLLPWAINWIEPYTFLAPLRFDPTPWRPLAIGLFLLFGVLGVWCGTIMAIRGQGTPLPIDTARELVVVGPYRWVRNPMAVSGLAQAAAVGLFLGSPGVLLYAVTGGIVWTVFVQPREEADLLYRFGDNYAEYRRKVRCWVPWPKIGR
jgi:protein-S-isoprenylcysteine O-methyltransferase Ste14